MTTATNQAWSDALATVETALAETLGQAAATLLVQGIDALVASLRQAPLSEQVVRNAFAIAAGVLAGNPASTADWQRAEVEEAIRCLMLDLHAAPADIGGMTVQQLAMLALAQAGYVQPAT